MLITCCLLAADGVLQISGKRKLTSGKMEDKENGKTPAQLKDELSGLKMRALQQKAEEVGVAQDLIDTADDSKEDLIDLILAVACKENGKTLAQLKDELSGLKMRALQQKAEEVGVAQDQIDEADDSKEDLIDLILAASAKEDPPGVAAEVRTSNKKSKNLATSAKEGPPGAAAEAWKSKGKEETPADTTFKAGDRVGIHVSAGRRRAKGTGLYWPGSIARVLVKGNASGASS